jgi:Fe-S-cluster containining protein
MITDAAFLEGVEAALAEGRERAGARLDYGRGCPACCSGPFPINALEARRLRQGLERLALDDPRRAAAVRARSAAAVLLLAPSFPGDAAAGRLWPEEGIEADGFYQGHASLPCPVLDPASGRCELYAFRPLPCRIYGPPVRLGDDDLPPCDSCFVGSPAEAEACRVVVDPADEEGVLLRELADGGETGETLIAFALLP